MIFPFLLMSPVIFWLAPFVGLMLSAIGVASEGVRLWGIVASLALLGWWVLVYSAMTRRPWYAVLAPLGNLLIAYIFLRAIARGRRVEWKDREYRIG